MSKSNMNLGIAYAVKNKGKKKMAEGGAISAKSEKRPMPDEAHNDKMQESHNDGMKAAKQDKWTDMPVTAQARKPSRTPLSAPKIVGSDAFSVRNRADVDKEKDLESSAKPGSPKDQPPKADNEMDAKKSGTKPHPMKMMAKGGMINEEESMSAAENDNQEDPKGLESDDDQIKPSDEEIMSSKFAGGGEIKPANISRPDAGWGAIISRPGESEDSDASMMAEGGQVEMEDDMHDSIADAIMAKRDRTPADPGEENDSMYAEGGQVDADLNGEEETNDYYARNQDAALKKENYDLDKGPDSQPLDSNEHGDLHEADEENLNDMVSKIRRKIAMKRNMSRE